MFKVDYNNTRTTSLTSFWCFNCLTPFSCFSYIFPQLWALPHPFQRKIGKLKKFDVLCFAATSILKFTFLSYYRRISLFFPFFQHLKFLKYIANETLKVIIFWDFTTSWLIFDWPQLKRPYLANINFKSTMETLDKSVKYVQS